jgi:hypothetical protein
VTAVKCAELREEVTVYVALERRPSGRTWTVVARGSKGPKTVKANNKLDQNASIPCLDGTYRTKGYASARDDDGVVKRSGSSAARRSRSPAQMGTAEMGYALRPPGVPVDAEGFPQPLLRIREWIRARGGDVTPFTDRWRMNHPHAAVPDIWAYFHLDGWVEIGFGKSGVFLYSPQEAYSTDFGDSTLTQIEAVVAGILEGGYREYVVINDDGVLIDDGSELDYPGGSSGDLPAEQPGTKVVSWTYPAWPTPFGSLGASGR